MKAKKIVSKIIMILIFLAVILVQNNVNAANTAYKFSSRWGGSSTRPSGLYKDLVYDTGVYCMQRNVQIYSPALYDLVETVTIEGNKCNGTTKRSNAIMGYIFACPTSVGGSQRYTEDYGFGSGIRYGGKRQNAIWYYMNTWLSGCGLEKYCVYGNGGYCDFIKKAEKYADNLSSQEKIYTATIRIFQSRSGTQRLMTVETGEKEGLGKLTVKKIDYDNTSKKLNMKFKVQTDEGWLSGNPESYVYDKSFGNASTYSTVSGSYTLKDLKIGKKYKIWETESFNPTLYPLDQQKGYDASKRAVNLSGDKWIKLTVNSEVTVKYKNKIATGDLVVKKIDSSNANKVLRMGFKVEFKDGKWLTGNNSNNYVYTNSFQDGDVYHTNFGVCTLKGLLANKEYRIWEVESPDPILYPLNKQKGYDSTKNAVNLTGNTWVKITAGKETTLTLKNDNIPISISGFVWVDSEDKYNKENYDNLYNSINDSTLEGIDVYLYEKRKDRVQGNLVASTRTDKNGKYTFKNIVKYNELTNYYVEFDYSRRTIKEKNGVETESKYYIPVVYNATAPNGSRALMSNMHGDDTLDEESNKIESIVDDEVFLNKYGNARKARTYRRYRYTEKYGLETFVKNMYNQNTRTLQNINLGIRKIYNPDYSIVEDLKCVVIKINNYQYTYGYGEKLINYEGIPTIQVENKQRAVYSRSISATDIYHLDKNPANGIEVYAIYNINITNNEKLAEKDIYVENKLHIESLTNTFSVKRYELSTTGILKFSNTEGINEAEIAEINNDIKNWKGTNNEGEVKYSKEIEVASSSSVQKYVQFKVKRDEILRILDMPEGLIEDRQTIAHTIGYHSYTRNEYAWENLINSKIKNELKYENRWHKSIRKIKEDDAPYLKFVLGEDRKITGTIFEDLKDMTGRQQGEALGNGKYDNGENKVKAIGVVLVDINGNPIKRYERKEDLGYEETDSIIYSNDDGTYTISGITPGDYYLKYIYDNNSSINGNPVNVKDYKSTIITNDVIKNAFGYGENRYGNEWYKYLDNNSTYSVAVDDLRERVKVNENGLTSIFAMSPQVDITIENTKETERTYDPYGISQFNFGGFYFGIIKQPEQIIEINKKITKIELTNNPNTILSGNPETGNMPGVTDLDENNADGGSTYTRVEIDKKIIHGATIRLTYSIELINNSDVNYYETEERYKGWYYMFGDYSHSKPVEIKVEKVIDGYEQSLTYSSNLDNVEQILKSESDSSIKATLAKMEIKADENDKYADRSYNYEKALSITGWKSLKRNDKDSVSIEFYKELSNEDEDLDFIGVAAIHSAKNVTNEADKNNNWAIETLKYVRSVILPEPAYADATITEPTGNLKNIIIVTAGIVGLVVLGVAAITIIKKKKTI